MQTKAAAIFDNLSPELLGAIKKAANEFQPLLDNIHANTPTTKNYYAEYMGLIAPFKAKGEGMIKFIGLSLLYAGANPQGIDDAVKYV